MKDHPSQWIHSGLTCHDVSGRVSEYLDDRFSIMTKFRIRSHLAACVYCHAYVRQISLVRDTVAFLPKQFPSPINRLRLRQHFAASHPH
jgi:hypothetical protein